MGLASVACKSQQDQPGIYCKIIWKHWVCGSPSQILWPGSSAYMPGKSLGSLSHDLVRHSSTSFFAIGPCSLLTKVPIPTMTFINCIKKSFPRNNNTSRNFLARCIFSVFLLLCEVPKHLEHKTPLNSIDGRICFPTGVLDKNLANNLFRDWSLSS